MGVGGQLGPGTAEEADAEATGLVNRASMVARMLPSAEVQRAGMPRVEDAGPNPVRREPDGLVLPYGRNVTLDEGARSIGAAVRAALAANKPR